MSLILKSGVMLHGLQPQTVVAIGVAASLCKDMLRDCVVTNCNDSTHGAGSLHYEGRAVDIRSHEFTREEKLDVLAALRVRLPGFDVLLESVGTPNEHFHLEWDDKRPARDEPVRT